MDPILILSSSRGGSTIVTETLRQSQILVHLPGEINPLLRLCGLAFPESQSGSDALDSSHPTSQLEAMLLRQTGRYGPSSLAQLVEDCSERLCWQWPDRTFQREQLEHAVLKALQALSSQEAFTRSLLTALDLPFDFYDLGLPQNPPHDPVTIIEEPPFILFSSWQHTAPSPSAPLLIKTPSNAYRLPFFQKLFKNFRVLHLTRNPAASINGLLDGWRYPGFHSHPIKTLAIPDFPGQWWKFDLPPTWEQYQTRPLIEICAFQWISAHQHILSWLHTHPQTDVLQVQFEDFLLDAPGTTQRICEWIGIPFDSSLQKATQSTLAPRMSTERPRQRRWFERKETLEQVLKWPALQELLAPLGYKDTSKWL